MTTTDILIASVANQSTETQEITDESTEVLFPTMELRLAEFFEAPFMTKEFTFPQKVIDVVTETKNTICETGLSMYVAMTNTFDSVFQTTKKKNQRKMIRSVVLNSMVDYNNPRKGYDLYQKNAWGDPIRNGHHRIHEIKY